MKKFRIYTDGSFSGKSGDGGYAALLLDEDGNQLLCIRSQLQKIATNNIMELEAIRQSLILISGFKYTEYYKITICSDSAYSLNAITVWARNWIRRNWKTSKGQSVSNSAIIKDAYSYWVTSRKDKVAVAKVKAHENCKWNNVVDGIAVAARNGVCSKCCKSLIIDNPNCNLCQISRSPEWLQQNAPSLSHLVEKNVRVGKRRK